jgi:curved DNA-binding protein CbpA/FixJ family two-component response regulator
VPASVLIVEDEESASRLIASICSEVGLRPQATRSGVQAKNLLTQAAQANQPFAAVVLDLVLGELDGFQVGQFVRGQGWGAQLPLIVVSGVYKQPNAELMARLKPHAYLAKPFEPSHLRDALVKACNVQGVATAVEGDLGKKAPSALLIELLRLKSTALLTLTQGTTVRNIHFEKGQVRFAHSNLKGETAGAAQVASGVIKQASFDRAVAFAKQNKMALHEALAYSRVLTPEQLKQALKQQTAEACINGLAWTSGSYRIDPQSPEQLSGVPEARTSPVALVLEAAKRFGAHHLVQQWLEARAQDRMSRSPELDRELFALKSSWPGEGVTPFATNQRSVSEALSRVKEAELPLLMWLCQSGLVTLSGSARPVTQADKAAAARPEDEDRGKTFTADEDWSRRVIFADAERLKDANHYQVLSVQQSASPDEIKAAYIAAAKRLHSDAFAGQNLGSARRVAEQLFSRVSEANAVLSSPSKRAEYDVYLDRKAKGLPTDVGAILRAEGIFQKGELLFKAGKFADAEAAFREAIGLNHAEAEFHAYLGMSIYRGRGKAQDGLHLVEKALQLDPRLHSGTLFAARISEALGEVEKAKAFLRKAIQNDPEFDEAKSELSRLKRAPAEQKKGFFERLLKK